MVDRHYIVVGRTSRQIENSAGQPASQNLPGQAREILPRQRVGEIGRENISQIHIGVASGHPWEVDQVVVAASGSVKGP